MAIGAVFLGLAVPGFLPSQENPLVIATVAGTGDPGPSGDGGPAVQAHLGFPTSVAVGPGGVFYISDWANHRIRRVGFDGIITTYAGTGVPGFTGDGGAATQARLNGPNGMVVDTKGNLLFADTDNHRVRRIDLSGRITTVAGDGTAGFSGDRGPASQASLNSPVSVAVDAIGAIYIADRDNHRIRRIDPVGSILTVAGDGIAGFSGDGGQATQARLNSPLCVAVDPSGSVYIADLYNHRIRRIGPDGSISTLAGSGPVGRDQGAFSGDGGPAIRARLSSPHSVAIDSRGVVYISDNGNQRVRRVAADGVIATYAGTGVGGSSGDGGLPALARLRGPEGLAIGPGGEVYIADAANSRIRLVSTAVPAIALSESSLAFDTVRVGEASEKALNLSNRGTGILTVSGIALGGSDAGQFRVTPDTISVLPGATRQVTVVFTPSTVGTKTATLSITHNAGTGISSVGLVGIAGAALPTLVLSADSLAFGDVQIGERKTLSVPISNSGGTDLFIAGILTAGTDALDFTVSPPALTIPPGQTRALTVTFSPASSGTRSAYLSLPHNAAGSPSRTSLVGYGVAPSEPRIVLSDTALAFDTTRVWAAAEKRILILNAGVGSLRISAVTLGGRDPAQFGVSPTSGVATPGAPLALTLRFAPTAEGSRSALLTIHHNASGSPTIVPLRGSGVEAPLPRETAALVYPNPFNPDLEPATIRFRPARDGRVALKIYDMAGNLVRTLTVEDFRRAGTAYTERWDGKNGQGRRVANGLYLCVIEFGSDDRVWRKIAVLR